MCNSATFSNQVRDCVEQLHETGVPALAGLFDLTSMRLVRLAVTITRNQDDAEDAVQSALVRVADDPCRLKKTDEPWNYLLRMVRNESLMIVRRRKSSLRLASLLDLHTRMDVDELEKEETFRAVWAALRRLPVAQSEVVVLKVWEELTFAQIGKILDIAPATAASRYRYALEKLSRKLARHTASSQGVRHG